MKKNYLLYIAGLLIFGSNGSVAGQLPLSSYEIVLFRTAIGSVVLWLLYLLTKTKSSIRENPKEFVCLALSGAMMGFNWLFLYEAYQKIGVGLGALACYCGPVIVMILSPLLFREKLTWAKLLGFGVVVTGTLLCNGKIAAEGGSAWGLFCGAMAAVTIAALVILNKKAPHFTGIENTVWEMTFAFVVVAIYVGAKQGFGFIGTMTGHDWFWALVLGVFNTGVGCYCYFSAISKLPVQSVSILGYLEPLSSILFAMVFLRETMSPWQLVGAVCILGGAAFGECFDSLQKKKRVQA